MKTIKNILITIFIIMCIITLNANISNAFSITELNGSITKDTNGDPIDTTKLTTMGNQALTVVSTIGSIVSAIVLIVLGIKYMTGSVEEKASYKKSLLPYFIGAVLIFGASTIYTIMYNLEIF